MDTLVFTSSLLFVRVYVGGLSIMLEYFKFFVILNVLSTKFSALINGSVLDVY